MVAVAVGAMIMEEEARSERVSARNVRKWKWREGMSTPHSALSAADHTTARSLGGEEGEPLGQELLLAPLFRIFFSFVRDTIAFYEGSF